MTEIKQHLDASCMSLSDFAYALGMRPTSLERMVKGLIATPDGVIADAMQVLADIDYVDALIEAKPEIMNINYKVFKLVLDAIQQDE
jgi:hypothetical protein